MPLDDIYKRDTHAKNALLHGTIYRISINNLHKDKEKKKKTWIIQQLTSYNQHLNHDDDDDDDLTLY